MPHGTEYSIQLFPVWFQDLLFALFFLSKAIRWLDREFQFLKRNSTVGVVRWFQQGAAWLGDKFTELTDDPLRYPAFRTVQRVTGYAMAVVAYSLALMVLVTGLSAPFLLIGQPKLTAAMIIGVGMFAAAYTVVAKIIWVRGSHELVRLHPELAKLERVAKDGDSRRKPRRSRSRPSSEHPGSATNKGRGGRKQVAGQSRSSGDRRIK